MTDPKRTFSNKSITRSVKVESAPICETRAIPLDAKLLPIKEAAAVLTEQYGSGYSVGNIRRIIQDGKWIQGWHYARLNKAIKIYLPAVQDWQVNQS